jgi:integrase
LEEGQQRTPATLREFEYAVRLFVELHGDTPITDIRRRHVREFREAMQSIPVRRSGPLLKATLPELVEWSKQNEAPRVSPATVNKLLAAAQALTGWASDNGLIPDDHPWANPFSKMLLQDEASDREPWEMGELRTLFRSPVYASNARPKGGRGEAAYWLPLLGLFTGARLGGLASLAVGDVTMDEETRITILRIVEDEERGHHLKTVSSRRVVPVHHELVKLGFLDVVERRRVQDGERATVFPLLTQGPKGGYGEGWSNWFGHYIRSIGINNRAGRFHSFRHGSRTRSVRRV